MAKQKGIIKLEGTIGDITFLKTKDGYIAKEKTSVNADRIANDPAFERTRENGAEFGRAGKAGKVLRNAFRSLLQAIADSRMVSRLTQTMMLVVKADTTNVRGERNVLDGETELLNGFDFNINSKLSTAIYAPYTHSINRTSGAVVVDIPSFIPGSMIAAPSGTTHFKIRAAAAEVDFENGAFTTQVAETGLLPWDNVATTAINLSNSLPANSTHPLFLVLSIEFSQEVNGNNYSLNNGAFNAMSLIEVSGQ